MLVGACHGGAPPGGDGAAGDGQGEAPPGDGQGGDAQGGDGDQGGEARDGGPEAGGDPYREIHEAVDPTRLETLLRELSGSAPVTVEGRSVSLSERYTPEGKRLWRLHWRAYFEGLGLAVTEISYPTMHMNGESEGHDLEAVLPGGSSDCVVNVVHYDSIGPAGAETSNPGVDDDMTGMAVMMESARLLVARTGHLGHTVRFVATDYEEQPMPLLEGAHRYVDRLQAQASKDGFAIIAALDHEQSGWNCSRDGGPCSAAEGGTRLDVASCSPDRTYDSAALGDLFEATARATSTLGSTRFCIGENSDHYAFWEAGIPAIVYSEHDTFDNPHFDQRGGDTFDKIDLPYFTQVARLGATFSARLAVIDGR